MRGRGIYRLVMYRSEDETGIHVIWVYVKKGKQYPTLAVDGLVYHEVKTVRDGIVDPMGAQVFRRWDTVIW